MATRHVQSSRRIGFDIGGTFTDFILIDGATGALHLHKCLTTPEDPSIGALEGMADLLRTASVDLADVGHVVHGTTLVTNAIIERNGARLGLLTTRGFRDILEMGTEQRYDIHDLFLTFPEPLAARRDRREIAERVSRDGVVLEAIDLDAVRREVRELVEDGVEALAVCFLHAYKHPVHERAVRDLVRSEFPDLTVSVSSDVHPQINEYERSSTTAANAYVQPLMSAYVRRLERVLRERGFCGRFHLIQSSGGLTAPETAVRLPIRFLESGPAGGAQASALVGRAIGHADLLSFDMGGTTAKASLIQDGEPDIAPMLEAARVRRFKRGSGLPVHAPVIDMMEIGAGGGSIARVDELGLLKIGPESAGAEPGPACYGQGGDQPTVTDANLLLGYLDPRYFLGGRMALDTAAAESAMARLAAELGLSVPDAAWGIYDLVSENMAGAARVHIVEKGRDPRRYAMVAMGGAGPLHAARVARKLGMREVVVPPASGAASALGFLAAPVAYEAARSWPMRIAEPDYASVEAILRELEAEGRARLAEAGAGGGEGAGAGGARCDSGPAVITERQADMRLRGQMHQISVPLPAEPLSPENLPVVLDAFAAEYQRRYTHLYEGAEIEVLNWRAVCAAAPAADLSARLVGGEEKGAVSGSAGAGGAGEKGALKGHRRAWVPGRGAFADVPVHDRYAMDPGTVVEGPAIIEEREATTIVPDACTLTVDAGRNLVLSLAETVPSRIVVGTDTALEDAVARIEADPVGLEIMWSRMINIAEECWQTVIRTAFSLIIGEAQDFACEILDARGRQIVHSPRAMPVFNLTLPIARERDARTLPAGHPATRGRARHERSVALRGAPVRHRHRDPGVPRRQGRRVLRGGGSRHRHRRHQGQPPRPRDLRGRVPDPAHEALPGRRAERGSFHTARRERPPAGPGAGRRACPRRRGPHRSRADRRVHGGVRHARPRGPRPGGAEAGGDGDAPRRSRRSRTDATSTGSRRTGSTPTSASPSGSGSRATRSRSTSKARPRRWTRVGATARSPTRGPTRPTRSSASSRRRCPAMRDATGR